MPTPKPHTLTKPNTLKLKNKITPFKCKRHFTQGARAIVANFHEYVLQIEKTGKQSNNGGTGSLT